MKNKLPTYGKDINLIVEKLSNSNICKLTQYDCGDESINIHIGKTHNHYNTERAFLVIDTDTENVIAFFSLRSTALVFDSKDKRGIKLSPAIEIVTFAVDVKYQDMWMSENKEEGCLSNFILSYIIDKYINSVNNQYCAAEYIVLYSVNNAIDFYKKNLFTPFNEYMVKSRDFYTAGCTPMYFDLSAYNKQFLE